MRNLGNIAFICSGNICRSPMAEGLLIALLENTGIEAHVTSAGTLGIEDHPAASNAIRAAWMLGVDLTAHRSRGVDAARLRDQDAIIVMADEHAHSIEFHAPELRDRIHGLWEFTDQPDRLDEIGDPVGGDIEEFIACRDEIVECIRNWVDRRVSGARFPHLDT